MIRTILYGKGLNCTNFLSNLISGYNIPVIADTILQKTQPKQNLVTLNTSATAELVELAENVVFVSPQVITEPGYELPIINTEYLSRKYRYFYAAAMFDPGRYHNSVRQC